MPQHDAIAHPPIRSKEQLLRELTDPKTTANLHDFLIRLSASNTATWTDPDYRLPGM